jgi:TP901 family phage tail tape measure protein
MADTDVVELKIKALFEGAEAYTEAAETLVGLAKDTLEAEKAVKSLDDQSKQLAAFKKLSGDVDAAGDAMAQAKREVAFLKESMVKAGDKGAKLFAKDLDAAKKKVITLSDKQQKLKGKLEQSAQALKQSGVSTKNLAAEQARLSQASVKATQKLEEQRKALAAQALAQKKLQQAHKALQDDLAKAANIRHISEATKGFSDNLASTGMGLQDVTEKARAFDDAMAEVSTLLDDTSSLDGLSASVRDMAKAYGGTAPQQAKALYGIISAGASDAATAQSQLAAANKLAIGGVTDIETAADGLTSALNAYGAAVAGADAVSDAFFVAMKAGKTTIGELSGSIGAVAPLAATAGVSLDELLAGTAALTTSGLKTSEAMTALRAVLSGVIKPTSEAAQAAAAMGMQFDSAALKSKGLSGFLQDIAEKSGGSQDKMAKLFGSVEALGGVLALTGNQSQKFADTMEAMESKVGATNAAFEKMGDTKAIERMQAALDDMAITMGHAFSPAITTGATALADFISENETLVTVLGGSITALSALGIVAATSLRGYAALAGSVAAVKTVLIEQKLAAVGAAAGTKAVGAASAASAAPLNAAAAAATRFNIALKALAPVAALLVGYKVGEWAGEIVFGLNDAEQASANFAATQETVAAKLRDLSAITGINITSMDQFNQLVKDGALVQSALTGEWMAANEEGRRLQAQLDALRSGVTDQAAAVQTLSPAVSVLVDQFKAAASSAQEVSAALPKITKDLDLTGNTESIQNFALALAAIEEQGLATNEQLQAGLIASLKTLSGEELQAFQDNAEAAFGGVVKNADALAAMLQGAVSAGLEKLGVDTLEVAEGLKTTEAQALDTFAAIASNAEASADQIKAAYQAVFDRLTTNESLDRLKDQLDTLFDAGQIGAEQYKQRLTEIELKQRGLALAASDVEKAFKALGVTSSASLQLAADHAKIAFETISASGTASKEDLEKAFLAYAKTVVDSGDKTRIALAQTAAGAQGLSEQFEQLQASTEGASNAADTLGKKTTSLTSIFKKLGVDSIYTLTDIRNAMQGASEDDLVALEQALRDAFTAGIISGTEFGQLLEQIQGKIKGVQAAAEGSNSSEFQFDDFFARFGDDLGRLRAVLMDMYGENTAMVARILEQYKDWLRDEKGYWGGSTDSAAASSDTSTASAVQQALAPLAAQLATQAGLDGPALSRAQPERTFRLDLNLGGRDVPLYGDAELAAIVAEQLEAAQRRAL